jgi:hypothetical protein
MTVLAPSLEKSLISGAAILAIGMLVAVVTMAAITFLSPAKAFFAFAGLVLFLPVFLVRDPKAYGLLLLTLFTPVEIFLHTTKWLADPHILFQQFGMPGSGTFGIDIYVADLVLAAMLLPWLAELCQKRCKFYFPPIGYLFILYLIWAMIGSVLEAPSFYLALFQWCREILYFVFFLYIVNNVVTTAQFRAVVTGLVVGLIIESIIVIVCFQLNIGTDITNFQLTPDSGSDKVGYIPVSETGSWSKVPRATGTFAHPAMTAYYIGYILPIVLAFAAAARQSRDRILFGAIFAGGCIALVLTFSRAGMLGLIGSVGIFFLLARQSGLISRHAFARCAFLGAIAVVVCTPFFVNYLQTRPDAIAGRWELIDRALETYWRHPILGTGLNNSSAATEGSHHTISRPSGPVLLVTVVHNHYLIVLVEVGLVGFLLFFGFFSGSAMTAVRWMRAAGTETKLLLVGIVSAMAGVAVHNFGDPFGGHMSVAMLWLYTGLAFAACRSLQARPAPSSRSPRPVAPSIPRFQTADEGGRRPAT